MDTPTSETLDTIVGLIRDPGLATVIVLWMLWFISRQLWPGIQEVGRQLAILTDRAVSAMEALALIARELVEVQRQRLEK
jgi:hypothetical protein